MTTKNHFFPNENFFAVQKQIKGMIQYFSEANTFIAGEDSSLSFFAKDIC